MSPATPRSEQEARVAYPIEPVPRPGKRTDDWLPPHGCRGRPARRAAQRIRIARPRPRDDARERTTRNQAARTRPFMLRQLRSGAQAILCRGGRRPGRARRRCRVQTVGIVAQPGGIPDGLALAAAAGDRVTGIALVAALAPVHETGAERNPVGPMRPVFRVARQAPWLLHPMFNAYARQARRDPEATAFSHAPELRDADRAFLPYLADRATTSQSFTGNRDLTCCARARDTDACTAVGAQARQHHGARRALGEGT